MRDEGHKKKRSKKKLKKINYKDCNFEQLMKYKYSIEKSLLKTEMAIIDQETQYLESSTIGNVVKTYDQFAQLKPGRKHTSIKDSDRIFSSSSATAMLASQMPEAPKHSKDSIRAFQSQLSNLYFADDSTLQDMLEPRQKKWAQMRRYALDHHDDDQNMMPNNQPKFTAQTILQPPTKDLKE